MRRLVEHYRPERIYLFGSSARGETRPDSDLDFLVVLPDDTPRSAFFDGAIYQRLWDIQERAGWIMSLPAIALREGKLEYDASAVSA